MEIIKYGFKYLFSSIDDNSKSLKQCRCLAINDWLNKPWHILYLETTWPLNIALEDGGEREHKLCCPQARLLLLTGYIMESEVSTSSKPHFFHLGVTMPHF